MLDVIIFLLPYHAATHPQKLPPVAIQTYIAKLRSTIEDLETEALKAKNGDDDDAHAHYHGEFLFYLFNFLINVYYKCSFAQKKHILTPKTSFILYEIRTRKMYI